MKSTRKVLFLTGTRADFGKLKPLIRAIEGTEDFEIQIFTTGMHMLSRYGSTWYEVAEFGKGKIHPFVNQSPGDAMDQVLSKTISGLSDFVREWKPDLVVVHGDRVEALAGAAVGALNNILVCHLEGGELSGTVDEILRHAISKLSHLHFVANQDSKNRLLQMGELDESVHVIGSPDIDAMEAPDLPSVEQALEHYNIQFEKYGVLIFHPVTTELENLEIEIIDTLEALEKYGLPIIVIESNNDSGSDVIQRVYESYSQSKNLRFFPSMRFEYFLAILKNAEFMIGNSSAGVREAPHFGVPAINLGSRQRNRVSSGLVLDTPIDRNSIQESLRKAETVNRIPEKNFGDGKSANRFRETLAQETFWLTSVQKQFRDRLIN